jgi:hypothetical protein
MNIAYVTIKGNKPGERIGVVRQGEEGYYLAKGYDVPTHTIEEVKAFVLTLNEGIGIPEDVAQSAYESSMFGWQVPAAERANHFWSNRPEMISNY